MNEPELPREPELPGIGPINLSYNQTLIQPPTGYPPVDVIHIVEKYCPGATREMLDMAKKGQQAIIDSNSEAMHRMQVDVRWAQVLGFGSIIISIVASLWSVHMRADYRVSIALASWAVGKGVQEALGRFIVKPK